MGVPYGPLIQQAARQYKIPPSVLAGLIDTESGFDPNSVSSAGARGLTQFMPGTAKSYGVQFGSSPAAVRTQIFGAARYLAEGGYHQDPGKALSGYVAGPAGGRQQWYVDRVLSASRKPQFQALNRGGLGQALTAPAAGRTATATVTRNVELPGGSGSGIADLLGELGQERPAPQVSLPTAPVFAAGPRLAGGAIPQLPVLGPAMPKSGVDEALRELESQDRPAQQIPVSGSASATAPAPGFQGFDKPGGFVNRGKLQGTPAQIIDHFVLGVARKHGIDVTPSSVTSANHAHGPTKGGSRSDHQGPPGSAWAADMSNGSSPTPQMDALARDLARAFGIPWNGSGLVSKQIGPYRVQLIYRIDTPSAGNHFNHVHFGIRRTG